MRTQREFVRISRPSRLVADAARLSMALIAAVAIAGAARAAGPVAPGPASTGNASAQDQTIGVFSGKLVNGIPLYRLPSISVSASRAAELAKIEREEHLTRAKQAKARVAARPPA